MFRSGNVAALVAQRRLRCKPTSRAAGSRSGVSGIRSAVATIMDQVFAGRVDWPAARKKIDKLVNVHDSLTADDGDDS